MLAHDFRADGFHAHDFRADGFHARGHEFFTRGRLRVEASRAPPQ